MLTFGRIVEFCAAKQIVTFITTAFDPRVFPVSRAIPTVISGYQGSSGDINDHTDLPIQ
jgi:hypothetical protein